jgi:hypothetical protein
MVPGSNSRERLRMTKKTKQQKPKTLTNTCITIYKKKRRKKKLKNQHITSMLVYDPNHFPHKTEAELTLKKKWRYKSCFP